MTKTLFSCTCSRQCCYSDKHLLTFNSAFGAGDFWGKSPQVPSFLVSSCPRNTRGMKAAADFLPCSYPHFTAGETETFWIVSLPVELHRNVNALSKTRERVSVGARIKTLLVLYFRTKFPSDCAAMRDPNTRSWRVKLLIFLPLFELLGRWNVLPFTKCAVIYPAWMELKENANHGL